jgi:hypothetical protein
VEEQAYNEYHSVASRRPLKSLLKNKLSLKIISDRASSEKSPQKTVSWADENSPTEEVVTMERQFEESPRNTHDHVE